MVKTFVRAARKADLDSDGLRQAAMEVRRGQVEARLTDILVKKRIARRGGGKRSGFRLIVAVRQDSEGADYLFGTLRKE